MHGDRLYNAQQMKSVRREKNAKKIGFIVLMANNKLIKYNEHEKYSFAGSNEVIRLL